MLIIWGFVTILDVYLYKKIHLLNLNVVKGVSF